MGLLGGRSHLFAISCFGIRLGCVQILDLTGQILRCCLAFLQCLLGHVRYLTGHRQWCTRFLASACMQSLKTLWRVLRAGTHFALIAIDIAFDFLDLLRSLFRPNLQEASTEVSAKQWSCSHALTFWIGLPSMGSWQKPSVTDRCRAYYAGRVCGGLQMPSVLLWHSET